MTKRQKAKRDALVIENADLAVMISRHVAGMMPNWYSADDLAGAAYVGLVNAAAIYDPSFEIPFRKFAQRRIYGACFDEWRKLYRQTKLFQGSSEDIEYRDDGLDPEQQVYAHEQRIVWLLAQRLPSRHRVVILGVYGGGMTLVELAGLVGVGKQRLSQIHVEALKMLRGSCKASGVAA